MNDEQRQWEIDHPDGVISDEEEEAMARYAFEACRDEGHAARAERSADERRGRVG